MGGSPETGLRTPLDTHPPGATTNGGGINRNTPTPHVGRHPIMATHTCPIPGCPTPTRTRYCPTHTTIDRSRNQRNYRKAAASLYGAPCVDCGGPADTADHIIPLSAGGTNHITNLQPMCRACNAAKLNR